MRRQDSNWKSEFQPMSGVARVLAHCTECSNMSSVLSLFSHIKHTLSRGLIPPLSSSRRRPRALSIELGSASGSVAFNRYVICCPAFFKCPSVFSYYAYITDASSTSLFTYQFHSCGSSRFNVGMPSIWDDLATNSVREYSPKIT